MPSEPGWLYQAQYKEGSVLKGGQMEKHTKKRTKLRSASKNRTKKFTDKEDICRSAMKAGQTEKCTENGQTEKYTVKCTEKRTTAELHRKPGSRKMH